jgi:hypothetical protein
MRCDVCGNHGETPIVVRPDDAKLRPEHQLPTRLNICSQACLDLYHDSIRLEAMKS